MKKNLLVILSSIIYVVLIIVISIYVITPGIDKLKDADNIKELTYEEKTELIDEINAKYITLEKEAVEKYNPSIEEINNNYNKSETEIKKKYDDLEEAIKDKYDKEEVKINNEINNNKVLQNQEFFANGLSKKYYELSDKGTELYKQKSELDSKEREEIRNNTSLENKELETIKENRESELNTIEDNKEKELQRLSEKKTNEINAINNQNVDKTSTKNSGIIRIVIGIVIILIPLVYIILVFNKLTHLSNSVKEKWSQVDVFLKQRADLIPNIVEAVKGYSKHEKGTLSEVTKARNKVINASTKEEEIEANKDLSNVVTKIFALQEDYPELKANTNFMDLQDNLKEIEDSISLSRQLYNKSVLKYKNKLEMFPSNIVASIFNFKPELFFEIDETDKENPDINLE